MSTSIKSLLSEYGAVALTVYLVIFALTLAGFAIAIQLGFKPSGAGGQAGLLVAAYVATKVTQPIRIGATILLTPLVAKGWERLRGPRAARDPDIH